MHPDHDTPRPAKILVVDDDPLVLSLIDTMLRRAGYAVVTADQPARVMSMAITEAVDAVVLDVVMPDLSGIDVLRQLRREPRTETLPVLMLSGLASAGDRVRGLREGADDYMAKPFEAIELLHRVKRLLLPAIARASAAAAASGSERRDGDPPPARDDAGRTAHGQQPARAHRDDEISDTTQVLFSDDDPETDTRDDEADDAQAEPRHRQLGRYEVLGTIGIGAMGTVFRGIDPRLQRQIALKTLNLSGIAAADQRHEMLDRLRREAITIAQFHNPHIVAVYDMGDGDEGDAKAAFIAMELIDGMSLSHFLELRAPLPADQVIPLGAAIAEALATAHAYGVIHRDVKPGNVLLGRNGTIKVTDFGLAHAMSSVRDEGETQIFGTPGYVPPEVLMGDMYGVQGDVFSLGVLLYRCLTGIHPLRGKSLRETLRNNREARVVPLRDKQVDVPQPLAALVHAMLARHPDDRPNTAAARDTLNRMVRTRDLRWSPEPFPDPAALARAPGSSSMHFSRVMAREDGRGGAGDPAVQRA
ncbi:MAG: protein kinase [Acidobacteriota bacterium]